MDSYIFVPFNDFEGVNDNGNDMTLQLVCLRHDILHAIWLLAILGEGKYIIVIIAKAIAYSDVKC